MARTKRTPGYSRASLLGLPAEVRLRIYQYVLVDAAPHIRYHANDFDYALEPGMYTSPGWAREPAGLRITQTALHTLSPLICRTIREESRPLLQAGTKLSLCTARRKLGWARPQRMKLFRIPSDYIANIRSLELNPAIIDYFPFDLCQNLQELRIGLRRVWPEEFFGPGLDDPAAPSDASIRACLLDGLLNHHLENLLQWSRGEPSDWTWSFRVICHTFLRLAEPAERVISHVSVTFGTLT